MHFLKNLFSEHCPKCNKVLEIRNSTTLKAIVIKSCPEQYYQKEFHPALKTYIESHKVI